MNLAFQQCIAIGLLCFHLGAIGEEIASTPAAQHPIPYRAEPMPVEDQSWRVGTVLLALLLATGLGLYTVRKRMPKLAGLVGRGNRLVIIERVRLDSRSTIYLIRLDNREMLIAQCGDHIAQLNAGIPISDKSHFEGEAADA